MVPMCSKRACIHVLRPMSDQHYLSPAASLSDQSPPMLRLFAELRGGSYLLG
jgi:hypothetical protein